MEDELELETLINQLRQQMTLAYEEKGTLTDACVIAISQELDTHIVRAQSLKSKVKTEVDVSSSSTFT
ncbi:aspartyl-phosphate phosphatase Spo0E family protein [Tumebacillus permanentifrigoris]|uniref:Spo0E like sporulation regulatory protein n=1 Tax=Tumebacillus permanentifrigoris TaxID=378543 RepID=A0A316DY56_9BACL|nr:aspartyl-phosphate phosphatase Spo0E family protein [Tumebacillus permanentifrigoris]PWK15051.1 Spo0E like sporulation regulatory protein [Tumebacillus permanentifrigoris]